MHLLDDPKNNLESFCCYLTSSPGLRGKLDVRKVYKRLSAVETFAIALCYPNGQRNIVTRKQRIHERQSGSIEIDGEAQSLAA
jgi:hypothetical protein